MRGDRYCVTRVTSCRAQWPLLLLRYLAIFTSHLGNNPNFAGKYCFEKRVSLFAHLTLIVSAHDPVQCTVLYIHFSGVGNFRTLHSTHSRLYSTNHCHCSTMKGFDWGQKNKIFETINLPTKMIECLSKCQD